MSIDIIEREAKLLETGSYSGRGLEITEEDLDLMSSNTAEAPVRIEHTDTPFDGALGVLKCVYRKGKELFGRLCFTKAAWELIKAANARKLSVAIKKDKSAIAEVSLVREPRVADAAVFSADNTLTVRAHDLPLDAESSSYGKGLEGGADGNEKSRVVSPEGEIAALKRELAEKSVDIVVSEFKRAGKLVPASEPFARAMLMAGDSSVITFGDGSLPVSRVFRSFLESQPKVIEFAELAPARPRDPDEPEIFAKLGVTLAQVEKHRNR